MVGSLDSVAIDVAPLISQLVANGLQTTHYNGNELKNNPKDSKYCAELQFGDFSDFLAGLEGMVGKPDRNLLAGLTQEHENDHPIESSNYTVKTTPRLEFRFVFDETERPDFAETSASSTKEKRIFKTLEGLRREEKLKDLSELELAAVRLYTGDFSLFSDFQSGL